MKHGHCRDNCHKYDKCSSVSECHYMKADLKRITKPRRRHRIELVFESELTGNGLAKWNNCIYGAFEDE